MNILVSVPADKVAELEKPTTEQIERALRLGAQERRAAELRYRMIK